LGNTCGVEGASLLFPRQAHYNDLWRAKVPHSQPDSATIGQEVTCIEAQDAGGSHDNWRIEIDGGGTLGAVK
jgi:hypothetical protein